jgi:hypothetical protein
MRIRYLSLAAREYFAAQDFYDNTEEGDSEALEAEIEQALRPAREGGSCWVPPAQAYRVRDMGLAKERAEGLRHCVCVKAAHEFW